MRNLFLSIAALAIFAAPTFGAEMAKAENAMCVCGKAVDAKVEPISIKSGEGDAAKTHTFAVCCAECGAKMKAMKAEDAVKAVEAKNPAVAK